MPITSTVANGVTFMMVPGDHLDAGNAAVFKSQFVSEQTSPTRVVLDLSELRFVDSSGLAALLACLRHLQALGSDLRLCGLTSQVLMLFELVRMQRVFSIFKTREEAELSFSQS